MPKLNSTGSCYYNDYTHSRHYISYSTTIAVESHGSDIAWYDPHHFSSTTCKHQGIISHQIRNRFVYNWYGVNAIDNKLGQSNYGKPSLKPYEWNELLEVGFIGGRGTEPKDFFALKSFADAIEKNVFVSWIAYEHLKRRSGLHYKCRNVYQALHERFGNVADITELYPTFRKQSKIKMRVPKYVSKMPQVIEDAKNVKFSVDIREKYLTAVLVDKSICSRWQARIRNNGNLYAYIQDNSVRQLTEPEWNVETILGRPVFDAIDSIVKAYVQAERDDRAYESGEFDVNAKEYFQCNLPSEFHSKKVFTLTGVHKADEVRQWLKSNKGDK